MKETIELIWDKVLEESEKIAKDNNDIIMYYDSYEVFESNFYYFDKLIRENFMKKPDEHLDRHKVAAVIICALVNNDILGIKADAKSKYEGEIFLANEKIAFNIALSYMYEELLIAFTEKKVPYESVFKEYVFPNPYSCDTNYDLVLCRDLYYAKTYFKLDPLSIANMLFLIEDYSFQAYGIKRI